VRFGLSGPGLEAWAMTLFLAAALASFKRLEANVEFLKLNTGALSMAEKLPPTYGSAVGEVSKPALEKAGNQAVRWYRRRNWCLWAGLALLAASRVLPSYLGQ
jgi:hypothetical protein